MAKHKKSKPEEPKAQNPSLSAAESTSSEEAEPKPAGSLEAIKEKQTSPRETFESYYLGQVTAEFADDIDKIRNASDFSERSVPVLIQALKQSAAHFTEEEKERVMGTKR